MNKNIIFLILLPILFSISFGTEPIPEPFYKYSISGTIQCDTLEDKSQILISLFGRHKGMTSFMFLASTPGLGSSVAVDLTDENGSFSFELNDPVFYDSLKISYNYKNYPRGFSLIITLNKNELEEIYKSYTPINNSGCSSCTTENEESRLSHFFYELSNFKLNMCK